MIWRLAKKIVTPSQLMTLALVGLKLEHTRVERCLYNRKDEITMATHAVLNEWNDSQEDKKFAYRTLCKALEAAKMNVLIYESKMAA